MGIYWIQFEIEGSGIEADVTNCTSEQLADSIRKLQDVGYTIVDVLRGDEAGAEFCNRADHPDGSRIYLGRGWVKPR